MEITESLVLQNMGPVKKRLAALRDMGVHLHLDDFGTGYSSLSALHTFPIDLLKIDRSFVSRLGQNSDSVAIIRAILAVAKSLNLNVVAEGIEHWFQLDHLREMGCQFGQGYLLSRPVAPDWLLRSQLGGGRKPRSMKEQRLKAKVS